MSEFDPLHLNETPIINPYRYGYNIIKNRLKWDLNPESWRSLQRLKACHNKYAGEKAVIVCNGPSLLKSDLSLLDGVFTFGLNKINLLFDKSSFRPSCIVAVNPFVIEQNQDFYNETDIPLYLDRYALKLINTRENITFIHRVELFKFARECSVSIYTGGTVTFVAMQLAYHLGFKDVALIGCDHNFATKGVVNMTVVSGDRDENHFDPNYFAGGVKWQLPDLLRSEMAYTLARDVYKATGRNLLNATEGGKLDILPRVALKEFLAC